MNSLLSQLRDIWSRLGVNQRVSVVLSLMGICIGMVLVLTWSNRPRLTLLYGGLEAADMSEVVELVEGQGVKYELRSGGASIYVPGNKVHELRMELASRGVPAGGGVGFEIFDQGNFGISDFVQRTNFIRAVQGELGRTISQLRGVRSARVMVVVPENKLLVNETGSSGATASVFVDTGGLRLDEEAVNSIRFLVANAVEGLQLNDVAVIDAQGNVLSQDLDDGEIAGANSQFKLRQRLEDYLGRKIESMLTPVVGVGNVVARVSVDITTDAVTEREERFDPEGQVARTETVTEDSSTSTTSETSQAAGVGANIPDAVAQGSGPLNSTAEERVSETVQYEINSTTREIVRGPGQVQRVQAAVVLGMRYRTAADGTREAFPRTEAELERLRMMVRNAIGVDETAVNSERMVTLEEAEFARFETADLSTMETVEETLFEYSDLIRNLIGGLIAVVFFVFFVRMVKRYKPPTIDVQVMEARQRQANGESPLQLEQSKPGAEITPEFLNGLIQEKPENVSTTLKQWVTANAKK